MLSAQGGLTPRIAPRVAVPPSLAAGPPTIPGWSELLELQDRHNQSVPPARASAYATTWKRSPRTIGMVGIGGVTVLGVIVSAALVLRRQSPSPEATPIAPTRTETQARQLSPPTSKPVGLDGPHRTAGPGGETADEARKAQPPRPRPNGSAPSASVQKQSGPPRLLPIAAQAIVAGTKREFTVRLTTPTDASNEIVFSLPEAPAWVAVDSVTGRIACVPARTDAPGRYPVTVRATSGDSQSILDEKSFEVTILKAADTAVQPRRPSRDPTSSDLRIKLPSGVMLTSANLDIRDKVSRDTGMLLKKCSQNAPDAMGFFQDGSDWAVASMCQVKGTKPSGAAVFFYSYQRHETPQAKQYITYLSGKWDGVLATWTAGGQREFWCNYSNGQRQGLCCLFHDNAPKTVLDYTRNKLSAVYLITDNEVAESITDAEQIAAHEEAGALLKEIQAIEQRLKTDDRSLCDRVKQGVQLRLGAINRQRQASMDARMSERSAQQNQAFGEMWKRAAAGGR